MYLARKSTTLHRVGAILFSLAIILGILLTTARAWPDMEAALYGFNKDSYPRLRSLHCPILMTSQDRLPVTIRITNPLTQDLTWYISAQFSSSLEITQAEQKLVLKPGEVRIVSWDVDRSNIDLRSLVLAYVFTSPFAGFRMTEGTCGTLVLNIPIQGGPVIYYASMAIFFLAGVVGFWLWLRHADMSEPGVTAQSWWMRFLGLLILIAFVAGFLSYWFLAILFLVLTLLTLIVYLVR